MSRIILTFENLHGVLAAEKALRQKEGAKMSFRTTPTPPYLTESICSMSLEVLEQADLQPVLKHLEELKLSPAGVHTLD